MSPAKGIDNERGKGDDIVIFEVMAHDLNYDWWRAYRKELETLFEQEEIVIRASRLERL